MAASNEKVEFKTPARPCRRQIREQNGDNCLSFENEMDSPTAVIPPSPFMEKLGCGTGVAVYLFRRGAKNDSHALSPWAVKKTWSRFPVDKTDNSVEKRLEKEAQILKDLKHENIVGFRAFSRSADGTMCLSMENGEKSLMDLIEERNEVDLGPFPASQMYQVALSLARALRYLHTEKHLLHGDLKSANVLVCGDFESVKLCDFGVALKLTESLDGPQDPRDHYIGTEPWSAPEIIDEEGPVTDKADIFSYGLVLWEMMSLTMPHVDALGDTSCLDESLDESYQEAAYQAALGTRPPLPDVPLGNEYAPLLSLFWACTQEQPARRPPASFIAQELGSMPPLLPLPMTTDPGGPADSERDKENAPMDFKR